MRIVAALFIFILISIPGYCESDFRTSVGDYRLTLDHAPGSLVSRRYFRRNGTRYLPRHYPAIRKFYEVARTGDQTTAVLNNGSTE